MWYIKGKLSDEKQKCVCWRIGESIGMPNTTTAEKKIIAETYGLTVHDVIDTGTCGPESLAKCYGVSARDIMKQASEAFKQNTECCGAILDITRCSSSLPPSMTLLLDKYASVDPTIALSSMVESEHTIDDTKCYYWWDSCVFEIFCQVHHKNIVLLEWYNESMRLQQLFSHGTGDTFVVLLFNVDHFMPCSIGDKFMFNMLDCEGFFTACPKVAELIDPRKERWFRNPQAVAGPSEPVPVAGVVTEPSDDEYVASEEEAFDKGDLVVISNDSVNSLTRDTVKNLFKNMVALAMIAEKNCCSRFLKCRIIAYMDCSINDFVTSELCCCNQDSIEMALIEHEAVLLVDALYVHGVSFMAYFNASSSRKRKRKSAYITAKEASMTAYVNDLNYVLTQEGGGMTRIQEGHVEVEENEFVWKN